MATDNKDDRPSIGNSDYAELLQHTVTVVELARAEIARHVNGYDEKLLRSVALLPWPHNMLLLNTMFVSTRVHKRKTEFNLSAKLVDNYKKSLLTR